MVVGQEPQQIFLIVDGEIIMEVSSSSCNVVLLSSFFVFNICYPKGCNNVYGFLEFAYFNTTLDKLTPTVKQFLANLSCH